MHIWFIFIYNKPLLIKRSVELQTLWKWHRHDTASKAAMRFAFLHAFSVSFGCLLTMLPRAVVGHGISSQNFVVNETLRNYCPGPEYATGRCYVKSMIKCAAECILHPECICLSYYATSRLCYLYNLAPQNMFYDNDCTFMMVSFQNKHPELSKINSI